MGTGKHFKVFMVYDNNPMAFQIQEYSTFVDLVSQFCLLPYQKVYLAEFGIKSKLCFISATQ